MIRRVRDGFGVADHPGVENNFPRDLGEGSETFARPDAAVFKNEDRFHRRAPKVRGIIQFGALPLNNYF